MSHPCLNDRRAGRPGSPRTQGRQRGQHPARLRGQHFVQYIYPGTTPPGTQVSLQLAPWKCTSAGRPLQHRQNDSSGATSATPPAMSSPGSQSVSALHLLLAFEQGASAAGHRFGRQGCARARSLTGLSRPLPSSPPWPWLCLRVARRTRDVPPSLKRPLFCTFRLVLQNLRTILLNEVAESESKSRVSSRAAAAAAVQVGSQHGNKRPLSGAEHGHQGKGAVT